MRVYYEERKHITVLAFSVGYPVSLQFSSFTSSTLHSFSSILAYNPRHNQESNESHISGIAVIKPSGHLSYRVQSAHHVAFVVEYFAVNSHNLVCKQELRVLLWLQSQSTLRRGGQTRSTASDTLCNYTIVLTAILRNAVLSIWRMYARNDRQRIRHLRILLFNEIPRRVRSLEAVSVITVV